MAFQLKQYVERHFDEIAIAGTLASVLSGHSHFNADDELILEALRRSTPELAGADVPELRTYLSRFDDSQLVGVTNNVKGIAHEIRFVELENEDGDSVSAVLFESPTHPGMDVILSDSSTGESWEMQLKATDAPYGVREWIEAHPDGQIAVTSELADRLSIESTGISNEQLTADVEDVIDRALHEPSLWDYFPALSVASMAVVLYSLYSRYRRGELSWGQLCRAIACATGWKIAKITLLLTLLSIPLVNVVTGTLIAAKLIHSGHELLVRA
ncbi:MAG: hypothetical protein GY716_24560 [bacterium]|nr:hypothetical protein [bacterium]